MASLVDSAGTVIIPRLELADTFLKRLVGLQFRKALPGDSGLCIWPCSSIHTCFMRFSIDVWMLDRQGRVLKCRRRVRPWRLAIAPRELTLSSKRLWMRSRWPKAKSCKC